MSSCFLGAPEKKQKQKQKQKQQVGLPAASKMAWRSFTCKLQSKLQKLTRLKNIECHLPPSPLYALRLKKKPYIKQLQQQHLHNHSNFETIYIDGLFRSQDDHEWIEAAAPAPAPLTAEEGEEDSKSTMDQLVCLATEDHASSYSSSSSCSTSSPLSEEEASLSVDERAEMFIAKVKQDMRLQKQRSIEDYLEMLARGL